jgi:hypothetical protein
MVIVTVFFVINQGDIAMGFLSCRLDHSIKVRFCSETTMTGIA